MTIDDQPSFFWPSSSSAGIAACGGSGDETPETITPAETDDSAISQLRRQQPSAATHSYSHHHPDADDHLHAHS